MITLTDADKEDDEERIFRHEGGSTREPIQYCDCASESVTNGFDYEAFNFKKIHAHIIKLQRQGRCFKIPILQIQVMSEVGIFVTL